MTALIRRELKLISIYKNSIVSICLLGPIVICLIPYLRNLRDLSELSTDILFHTGVIGVPAYLIFYIIYETVKCEREGRSIERAVAFWGIEKIIFVKSIIISGMGVVSELLYIIIFVAFQQEVTNIFNSFLLISTINIFLFSWVGTMIMYITDNLFASLIIASIPFMFLTIALLQSYLLFLILILGELGVGYVTKIQLSKKVVSGKIDWL